MDKDIPLHLHEVIFSSSNPEISRTIGKLEKAGKLKKIAPRVYTPNLEEDPAEIARRNLFRIVGQLYPCILLSHRSALEYRPTQTGDVFLTHTHNRKVELPGITLNVMRGHGATEGDNLLTDGLYISGPERAMLENLQESRTVGGEYKTLPLPGLAEKLGKIVRVSSEERRVGKGCVRTLRVRGSE